MLGQGKLTETVFILFKVFQLCQLIKQVFSVEKSALLCGNYFNRGSKSCS